MIAKTLAISILIVTLTEKGCGHNVSPYMCNSPQKDISCLVDPYFQFECKEACKNSQKLQEEVGYPELFSLPALVVMSAAAVDPNSQCRDLAPYCPLITVNIGGYFRCTTSPMVRLQCPESCGLCSNTGSALSATSSDLYSEEDESLMNVPLPDIPITPTCADRMPICFTVYAQFACLNDPHFQKECPQTCGLCQPPTPSAQAVKQGCTDLSQGSCKWVPNSMCAFQGVQIQCPAKCGLCPEGQLDDLEVVLEENFLISNEDYYVDNTTTENPTSTEPTTTEAPTTTEKPDEDCEDVLPAFLCKAFWAKFACADNTSDFKDKCKKSCGFCPKDIVTTTHAANDCKDLYPSFVCHAFWAKFACANRASGFSRKCRKSCGTCSDHGFWRSDEPNQDDVSVGDYSVRSANLQKLEALLAHYYLKLEQVPEEMFDYDSKDVCESDYMKKFGCVYDVVSSVFCKETCLTVINQLVNHPKHANIVLLASHDVAAANDAKPLEESVEDQPHPRDDLSNPATVVGVVLGLVAMIALIAGVVFRFMATQHTRRLYTEIH